MDKRIKFIIVAGLHVLSGTYLGVICKEAQNTAPMLMNPTSELLTVGIKMLIAVGGVILTSGLVAIIIQPFYAQAAVFILHGAAVLLTWKEFSLIGLIFTIVYVLMGIRFTFSVQQRMKDRIRVSLQPVSESRMIVLIGLVLIICSSLYLGIKAEVDAHGFHLPEGLLMAFIEPFKEGAMAGQSQEQREQAEAQFEEEFSKAMQQMQRETLKPIEAYIPILIPVMLFFLLETVINLLSFIPMLLLDVIFRLLKMAHFVKIEKISGEIEKLSL